MQHVGDGNPWPVERTKQWIDRAREMSKSNGYCQWALIHKESSALIGFCGFVPKSDGAEIGWRLTKEYWGKGLATEAALHLLKYGFTNLGFRRVIAKVQSLNRASMRVCEKLGMKPKSKFLRNDRDLVLYSINIPKD